MILRLIFILVLCFLPYFIGRFIARKSEPGVYDAPNEFIHHVFFWFTGLGFLAVLSAVILALSMVVHFIVFGY